MDTTNANTALASAFVEELARCGLRRAVVSPGSRSTPLAVALRRQPEIEVDVIVDERSAAFFALGAAQASGIPVALLCTSGTAAANYHPAICEADESSLPLVVLTADRPPELREVGAGQTIDQIRLYGSSVRWFCEVGTHEADDSGLRHLRSSACRAYASAVGDSRPGPVHLNLPWREPLAPLTVEGAVVAADPLALEGRGERPLTAVARVDRKPSAFLLDEVARHVAESERGVIVAGRQTDPELRRPLAELAAAAGMPILADPTSQLRCGPHDRSHVVSTYDLLLRDEALADGLRPDLVLRFGEMPTSKPLRSWLADSGADELIVDPVGAWNEPSRKAAAILRADPTELASGWAARVERGDREYATRWLAAESAAAAEVDSAMAETRAPSEPALQRALGAAYRDGDLVYTASSMPIRDQESYLPGSDADVAFLSNRGANGIDGLISSGIGAAVGAGRPTTIVTGDLGLLHDLGALAALRDADDVLVRVVVIDNGGGGIFHFLPQVEALGREEFEALLGTPKGVDAARAADLFGLRHRRLDSLADLPAALAAGSGLIEVRVERGSESVALRRQLAARAADAVRAS